MLHPTCDNTPLRLNASLLTTLITNLNMQSILSNQLAAFITDALLLLLLFAYFLLPFQTKHLHTRLHLRNYSLSP